MRVFVPGGDRGPGGGRAAVNSVEDRSRSEGVQCGICGRASRRSRTSSPGARSVAYSPMSPVHDQSYRRYPRFAPRTGQCVERDLQDRAPRAFSVDAPFVGLLVVLAWVPFLVRSDQIYFSTDFPQMARLAATAAAFRESLEQQGLFVFFMTIYVGAGLIAHDRRANALQIYLAKPFTRPEYRVGKLRCSSSFCRCDARSRISCSWCRWCLPASSSSCERTCSSSRQSPLVPASVMLAVRRCWCSSMSKSTR